MPEHQRGISDHEQFEMLCGLAAGGLLEGAEFADFQAHMEECSQCRSDYREFTALITGDIPRSQGSVPQKLAEVKVKPLEYSRQRFLRRARAEGVIFSSDVETPVRDERWHFRPLAILAPVAGLAVVAIVLTVSHFRQLSGPTPASAAIQHIAELERQNADLIASLSRLNQSLSVNQREMKDLREQVASESHRHHEVAQGDSGRPSSNSVNLLDEARDQEKLSEEVKDEAARSAKVPFNKDTIVEQQLRIAELTNKLRIVSATLDQERQLAAAGSDVRELMASRKLHVIDVRDADANGNPGPTFARVFLTEGKSLTFYAFDLNGTSNAKRNFEVWAVPEAGENAPRSLGFLRMDAKAQGRWVLKVESPELVKQIGSVFVTVQSATDSKQPSGQKMLYAYLGDANHP